MVFFFAARVDQAVGEDMTSFGSLQSWISSTARNAHRNIDRHGFYGAYEIAREFWNDALLTGDERHIARALRRTIRS